MTTPDDVLSFLVLWFFFGVIRSVIDTDVCNKIVNGALWGLPMALLGMLLIRL